MREIKETYRLKRKHERKHQENYPELSSDKENIVIIRKSRMWTLLFLKKELLENKKE